MKRRFTNISSRKSLSCALSMLEQIKGVKRGSEQYQTDPDIASSILWEALMHRDIEERLIIDAGCGNGVFGIGGYLLGAEKTNMIENDLEAIKIAERNINKIKTEIKTEIETENMNKEKNMMLFKDDFLNIDLKNECIDKKNSTIIMNPPFGTKNKHADREFLSKAIKLCNTIYSIHLVESREFLEKFFRDNEFSITGSWKYEFPIPKSHERHKKKVLKVPVICIRAEKNIS